MKNDIVKRLREREEVCAGGVPVAVQGPLFNPDGPEAADEIERLRAENERLKSRLRRYEPLSRL